MSGAVTMKITSSTSITSMYGTTFIWLIGLAGAAHVSSGRARDAGPSLRGAAKGADETRASCHPWRWRMFENSSMKVS